jgi:uncharacterized lipoprotein YmbA
MSARGFFCMVLLAMTACSSSPDIRYYTLSAQDPARPVTAELSRLRQVGYALDAVRVPEALDRPQIVLGSSANSVEILDYDRWAAPLPDLLQRVLVAGLSARLGADAVVDPGLPAAFQTVRRITVSILKFDPRRQGSSLIEASWTVSDGGPARAARIETYRSSRLAESAGPAVGDVVATMNALVAALADDMAETVSTAR